MSRMTLGLGLLVSALTTSCGMQPQSSDLSTAVSKEVGHERICDALQNQFSNREHFPSEISFLCNGEGLQNAPEGQALLVTESQPNGLSYFEFAARASGTADLREAEDLLDWFCADFEVYRQISPDAFSPIESVATSMTGPKSCNYHMRGKRILFWRPEFKGAAKVEMVEASETVVFGDYLTRSISLIKDSSELVAVTRTDEGLLIYVANRLKGDTKGQHSEARTRTQNAVTQYTQGLQQKLGSLF